MIQGVHRDSRRNFTVKVEEDASATFYGQVIAKEVSNFDALFRNAGTMEYVDV